MFLLLFLAQPHSDSPGYTRPLVGLAEAPGAELPSLRLQPETEPRG